MSLHSLYTPEKAASVAVAQVQDEAVLAALVNRSVGEDVLSGGGKGRVVNVKLPTALAPNVREIDDVTNELIMSYITEQTVPVKLGVHVYNAVPLSEGDMSLDLANFSEQVLQPQSEAVASYFEHLVVSALKAETSNATLAGKWASADPVKFFTALRKHLRDKGVPQSNLNVVVGTGVYAAALDAGLVSDASQSGSTAALRDANIGRLRGFNIVESIEVAENDVMAFHRDAYTLANRAPVVPQGASFGARITSGGYDLRYIRDYASTVTVDRSIVSTFAGIAKMPLYKITRTQPIGSQGDVAAADNPADEDDIVETATYVAGSATVSEVAGGAVVRATVTL